MWKIAYIHIWMTHPSPLYAFVRILPTTPSSYSAYVIKVGSLTRHHRFRISWLFKTFCAIHCVHQCQSHENAENFKAFDQSYLLPWFLQSYSPVNLQRLDFDKPAKIAVWFLETGRFLPAVLSSYYILLYRFLYRLLSSFMWYPSICSPWQLQ